MQDDSRYPHHTSADGLGCASDLTNVTAGHRPGENHLSLTESNLSRHTRIYPPNARDTVKKYLQGLERGREAGVDEPQTQLRQEVHSDRRVDVFRKDANNAQRSEGRSAKEAPDERAASACAAVLRGKDTTSLVAEIHAEPRQLLVASMKSKQESVPIKNATHVPPLSLHSSQSSTCDLLQAQNAIVESSSSSERPASGELVVTEHIPQKRRARSASKRKLSDPGSGDRERKGPRHITVNHTKAQTKHREPPIFRSKGEEEDVDRQACQ